MNTLKPQCMYFCGSKLLLGHKISEREVPKRFEVLPGQGGQKRLKW